MRIGLRSTPRVEYGVKKITGNSVKSRDSQFGIHPPYCSRSLDRQQSQECALVKMGSILSRPVCLVDVVAPLYITVMWYTCNFHYCFSGTLQVQIEYV